MLSASTKTGPLRAADLGFADDVAFARLPGEAVPALSKLPTSATKLSL